MNAPVPRLALSGIGKAYPSVVANADIDLAVMPGEIHALLGENGAGKSTLMKIVYGVVQPDAGEIRWEGEPTVIATPADARRLGIGMVFQHFSLFETLTVAENVAIGLDEHASPRSLAPRIVEVSHRYGLDVDPARPVYSLSVGERQRVEIVRALLGRPKLLILDEPTSVLTPQAAEALFVVLRQLSEEGVSILYISHKLREIRALAGRATVLRGGRVVATVDPRTESPAALARHMIGRDLPPPVARAPHPVGPVRLAAVGLTLDPETPHGTRLEDVSFALRAGEILGVAGVSGNGQAELLAALSGERAAPSPAMLLLDGESAGGLSASARRKRGLAYVPERRLGHATVPEMSLAENTLLTAHRRGLVRNGLVRRGATRKLAAETMAAFDVRAGGVLAPAESLSGGNLQKFVVGREVGLAPKVLVVAQPTWGVDVGATAFIRAELVRLRDAGAAVLVVSEDLDELLEVSDRIAVLYRGRLTPPVDAAAHDAESIGLLMGGAHASA